MQYEKEIPLLKHDAGRMNDFIKQHKSFIASCAYKVTGQYVHETDDAFQVAMIAFYEALEKYDPAKGGFLTFSSLVIRRRLLDELEKENRHAGEILFDPSKRADADDDAQGSFALEIEHAAEQTARETYEEIERSRDIKEEIESISGLLSDYGFSFYDLTKCSPKTKKTKASCMAVVRAIMENPEILWNIQKSRMLPIEQLVQITGVKRKILERHRKYLIAVSEIACGEYDYLRDYVSIDMK